MKKFILTAALTLTVSTSAFAGHGSDTEKHADAAMCGNKINVKVNGLVCDFCARALEKVFSKREEVSDIAVDLDNGNVVVTLNDGKSIDEKTLTTLITDSGYNVRAIEEGCDDGKNS